MRDQLIVKNQHSRGPWTIKGAHPWKVKCPTNIPGILGDIATVGYLPNARLIAAAPDLLAAAQEALACLADLGDDESPVPMLRAAIAKAGGSDA